MNRLDSFENVIVIRFEFELVSRKFRQERSVTAFYFCEFGMKQVFAMRSLKNSQHHIMSRIMNLFNFSIPRLFGLLSARYDLDTNRLVPSLIGLFYSIIIGHSFACIYPMAVARIMQHRTHCDGDESGVSQKVEILQHAITYLVSVAVFVRQMYFSKHQITTLNRGWMFYERCGLLCGVDIKTSKYFLSCVLRAIFSYIGYNLLTFWNIFYSYGNSSQVNLICKIALFLANIVITTTTIRFHSAIVMLTLSGRRINHAFHDCIESVNRTQNGTRAKQQRACQLAAERFQHITMFHAKWHQMAGIMEKSPSILLLFTSANILINLVSTVRAYEQEQS